MTVKTPLPLLFGVLTEMVEAVEPDEVLEWRLGVDWIEEGLLEIPGLGRGHLIRTSWPQP